MPFMPLDTERLLDSDMMALSTGDEFKTALRLWCKSWNQEPAASLPDDDRILAHLAGRELGTWKKVRDMALRGFIKCSDGRLYHPVIAEKALEAWGAREAFQAKKEGDNDRKKEEREDRKLLFAALRNIGVILPAKGTQTSQLRKVAESHGIKVIVTDGHKVVTVTPNGSHSERHSEVTAKTEKGTGTVLKDIAAAADIPPTEAPVDNSPPPVEADKKTINYAELLRVWEQARGKFFKGGDGEARLLAWREHGITEAQLRAAYDLAVADRAASGDASAVNVGFVDVMLGKVLSRSGAESAVAKQALPAASKPWPCSWSGIVAKGLELGIEQEAGEQDPAFKARVIAASGLTNAERATLRADWGVAL